MRRVSILFICLLAFVGVSLAQDNKPLLLRKPTASKTQIAFNYAGDLWIVGREGGDARRLTTGVGVETDPAFSPDGTQIAFTGEYAGNLDVYVVPAAGGVPRRLTYHPGPDVVLGWTPDGKKILFRSTRSSYYHFADKLFTVPPEGGLPAELPLPMGEQASFSPDGTHLAYVPHPQWQQAWKRYRGGQTTPIWIANLADSSIERIPRDNSNDSGPMWIGNTVYFLSDRNGPVSLFAYDTNTRQVTEVIKNDGLDIKSASAGPDAIVYEQFGSLHLYDLSAHQPKAVRVSVAADLAEVPPHFVKVEPKRIRNFNLSPTGARAVMEAWGEIFTVPTDKGDIRNLTRTPAVAERDPAWSPDGKWIAYFSDASGEYGLEIRDQSGLGEVRKITLGSPPSFFYSPVWSPDSKKIAYYDKRLNLWYVEVEKGTPVKVDTDLYEGAQFNLNWAPDSNWITYTKQLPSHYHGVYVYSLEQRKAYPITDGMSDALFPCFDVNGKSLYFTASTDLGLSTVGFDMSSNEHPITRSAYVVVLRKDLASPLAPESDEEKIKDEKKGEKDKEKDQSKDKSKARDQGKASGADKEKEKDKDKEKEEPVVVKIDFEGISQRILALPIPARNYVNMIPGKSGILFLSEGPMVIIREGPPDLQQTIQKFDLSKRKVDKFVDEVNDFTVSFNGEKLLYRKGEQWATVGTDEPPAPAGPPKPGIGPLKLDAMEVYVEPKAMWRQIYNEVWRIERDFFYDPHLHGLDLEKVKKKYEPYLDNVPSRDELTYLFEEALGEMTVGHMFVGGGEHPEPKRLKGGLLGADYTIENGRYRVARVFDGENWNPGLQAPLTQPGVNVKTGEYILAVDGRELYASDNLYSFFEETAGKQVVLKVGPNPDGKDSRNVTIVPVESEENLRRYAWVEGNRRKVDQMTGGRVAYVHLPNTAGAGYNNFNRYYFAQVGKDAAIIDERFNEGGQLADYIIDYLRRPLMSKVATREGADWSSPSEAIYGPKVMIINEMAGSGGDAMPWYFRKAGIGPLIGKKTWGGLIGIGGYPELIDGGFVTAPRFALYGLNGDWEVENHGIAPDYDVDLDPAAVRAGHDPQLEKAVEVVMDLLKKNPPPQYKKPEYPDYHKSDGLGAR
ncbi:MAG: PDZ domain-containing protein [Acidobacteriia bacterium]|nr:PDZ domain-containing protein [Terriglobia bacterium]